MKQALVTGIVGGLAFALGSKMADVLMVALAERAKERR